MNLWTATLTGLSGLLSDANAWFCFLILGVATFLGLKHIISDISFAAIFGTISTVYTFCAHRVDIAQMNVPPPPPQ